MFKLEKMKQLLSDTLKVYNEETDRFEEHAGVEIRVLDSTRGINEENLVTPR